MAENEDKQTILVVDDTSENIDVLSGVLRPEYKVKAALSGEQALKIAFGESRPDIILLDIMMPGMDGYEVCRLLKADDTTRHIPIIFITAKVSVQDELMGLDLGAVDYITKPISPPIVKARVQTHLALESARARLKMFTDKLARYVSPQIYQSILEEKLDARLETRRRKLTIFFSDIRGFTSLSETLEPEDLTFLLNSYLTAMAKVALKHGGTLDKFIGDAVLVFFGDPESRGVAEDAMACMEMAFDMQKAISKLADESIKRGIRRPLSVRMGVSTGYCTVGNFGSEERMDYTIIGRHANLAARLEAAAEPDQILISKETWTLVNSQVNWIQRDPVVAKGFSDPIEVFQVLGLRGKGDKFEKFQAERPGFKLELNPMEAIGENKEWIVHSLREALETLEKE